MVDKQKNVLVCGYSRNPVDSSAWKNTEYLSLALVVDKTTHTIVDASTTFSTDAGKHFISELFIGEVITDRDNLINLINKCYFGRLKKALINATISCFDFYDEHLLNKNPT
jgi:hypothetical protein